MRWLPAASLAPACALVAAGSLLAPAAGAAVPSGRPCGAVAVPAGPSMFGYPPTVGR